MSTEISKPRLRVPAISQRTGDSFQNFEARLGIGADNQASAAQYGFNPITRNRLQLEFMYRGSWVVGRACDVVAQDMVRAGIDIASVLPPDQIARLQTSLNRLGVWKKLEETITWARLYGGAIGVMLIDGQDPKTPLRPETIGRGQFKGILPLDRWMLQPSLTDLVSDFGPDLGKPKFYLITANAPAMMGQWVHYSRVIRADGVELPFWQAMTENGWGMSVVERLFDRLVAFDSTTQGAAQLVYKAHLRTLKVDGLRDVIAAGGKVLEGLLKQVDSIRRFQTNEGLTLLDAKDEFDTHQYTFSGLDSVLMQFQQQLSGALDIPLVRLFGQSPAGFSSGDADVRNYYDSIASQQNSRLRRPLTTILEVAVRSEFGEDPPEGFGFEFEPLWQLSDKEKADIAKTITDAVAEAEGAGLIGRDVALKELRQSSDVTGIWSNITDEDIEEAESDPPPGSELALGDPGLPDLSNSAEAKADEPAPPQSE